MLALWAQSADALHLSTFFRRPAWLPFSSRLSLELVRKDRYCAVSLKHGHIDFVELAYAMLAQGLHELVLSEHGKPHGLLLDFAMSYERKRRALQLVGKTWEAVLPALEK